MGEPPHGLGELVSLLSCLELMSVYEAVRACVYLPRLSRLNPCPARTAPTTSREPRSLSPPPRRRFTSGASSPLADCGATCLEHWGVYICSPCRYSLSRSEKQGYPYILQQPNVQKFVPKTYAKYVVSLSPLPSASLYPGEQDLYRKTAAEQVLTRCTLSSNYTYTPRKLRIHHSTWRFRFLRNLLRTGSSG